MRNFVATLLFIALNCVGVGLIMTAFAANIVARDAASDALGAAVCFVAAIFVAGELS